MHIQGLPDGRRGAWSPRRAFRQLAAPLIEYFSGGDLETFERINELVAPHRDSLGQRQLLNSKPAWEMLVAMYEDSYDEQSFLDYFWSWRALMGGLFSVLLGPMPRARVYHTVSTGYAGLYAARAHIETGRPAVVTEHGIYTNERRIEIAMADWLYELPLLGLGITKSGYDLKDLWMQAFASYSLTCYQACERIITLYEGNQQFQLADGAEPDKLEIVPNGIDYPRFSAIRASREGRPPQIALIGRVVPIKDVKTYLRACAKVREAVPETRAYVMGPTEEDPGYFEECRTLAGQLGLEEMVEFTGRVRLDDCLGEIDVIVLTSISEAQPLVLLEAGAVGIPSVATDVGSCREILLGRGDEVPPLGPGGSVTMLSDPEAAAQAIVRLLTDPTWYERCRNAIRTRVRTYYDERDVQRRYGAIYRHHMNASREEAPA